VASLLNLIHPGMNRGKTQLHPIKYLILTEVFRLRQPFDSLRSLRAFDKFPAAKDSLRSLGMP
jgi:hypothetical protein